MKKFAALFLSLALLFSFVTSVQAESKPLTVWIGDEQVQLGGNQAIIEKGTTLVPAKQFLEKLSFTVTWDNKQKIITAAKDGLIVLFQIGNDTALVNSVEQELFVAPKVVKGTSYIPLRTASEAAGYVVKWDSQKQAVSLTLKEASRGFLWKVENGESTVYLLGSIHIANEAMYPLRKEIQDAYKASDYLVVEADVTKTDDPKIQQAILDKSTLKDGTTLKDHVSADAYKKIGEILKENGLPTTTLDTFKPWSVASSIDYLTSLKSGYSSDIGIDMHFLQQAVSSKLPILELESFEFQLQVFDNYSDRLQKEMVDGSIASYYTEESDDSAIDFLSEMWVTGNDEQLLAITNGTAADPELYKVLLKDRNIGMVDKITGYLNNKEKKTYFVVVGAAHMLGEDGLVKLLGDKGFKAVRQ